MTRRSETLLYMENPAPADIHDEALRVVTPHAVLRVSFRGDDRLARLFELREWLAAALASVEGAIAKEAA